jgi:hypothetical protein
VAVVRVLTMTHLVRVVLLVVRLQGLRLFLQRLVVTQLTEALPLVA